MTKKQKKVADWILANLHGKPIESLDDLYKVIGVDKGEMIFSGALNAGYSDSTLDDINRGGESGYRIADAIEEYVVKKSKSNGKVEI